MVPRASRQASALTPRGRAARERIIDCAAALFHRNGVAGTSLDDVGVAASTGKSQFYHYFSDKSALVHAVIAAQIERVLTAQQPELDSIDSMATLRRWRDRVIAITEDGGCVGGCPLGRLSGETAEDDPTARAALLAGFTAWQQRLAAGLRAMQQHAELDTDLDTDALALALLAAVQGGLLLAQATRDSTPLKTAIDHVLKGIHPRTRDSSRAEPDRQHPC